MNQTLTKKQLRIACLLVLSVASLALFLFFKAPVNSDFDYDTLLLHNTAVTSLTINREDLTSPVLTNENPESLLQVSPSPILGGQPVNPGMVPFPPLSPEKQQAQEQQETREQKQFDDAVAYLKNEGVAVALGRSATPTLDDSPINVHIQLKGTGTRVAGRPTWGSYGYTVEIDRWVYLASGSRGATRVRVVLLSDEGGIVSPETLPKKQEEALGKALEEFVKEWKRCNPAAGKKP